MPAGAPSVRNINSLWTQQAAAYKARADASFAEAPAPTGPMPVGMSTQLIYPRHVSSVVGSSLPRHAMTQFPARFAGRPQTARLRPALGPMPMTTVLVGPRSPRRTMVVPAPAAASLRPHSARSAASTGPHTSMRTYVSPTAAAAERSGGLIVNVGGGASARSSKKICSDEELVLAHKRLQILIETRFKQMRRCFRMIDSDGSGSCSRAELKYMLNAMFTLGIPDHVLDRLIDLIDYDRDGSISFAEFCRVFTSTDILKMKHTLRASAHSGHIGRDNLAQTEADFELDDPQDEMYDIADVDPAALGADVRNEVLRRFTNLKVAFRLMDVDRSGYLDLYEVKAALDKWKIPYTRQRLEALFNQSDYDADGKLYYVEFVEALARDAPLLRAVNLGMKWK